MPEYPGRVVLRIKYNQNNKEQRVISFNAFWKFLRLEILGGLSFGPGIFWGFVGSPGDFLGL